MLYTVFRPLSSPLEVSSPFGLFIIQTRDEGAMLQTRPSTSILSASMLTHDSGSLAILHNVNHPGRGQDQMDDFFE